MSLNVVWKYSIITKLTVRLSLLFVMVACTLATAPPITSMVVTLLSIRTNGVVGPYTVPKLTWFLVLVYE
jgi:hypothetical protein